MESEYKIYPVGKVKKQVTGNSIEIDEEYRDALLELDNYNYIHVLWWASEFDSPEKRLHQKIPPARIAERITLTPIHTT